MSVSVMCVCVFKSQRVLLGIVMVETGMHANQLLLSKNEISELFAGP